MKSLIKILICLSVVFCMVSAAYAEEIAPVTTPSAKVQDAIALLKQKTEALGVAKADGDALFFGSTKMNDNYAIVDEIKTVKNCTATLFVKDGDNFIRVSTNVMTEGERAVGTALNVRGPAYVALSKGQSYYGIVDVVGKNYDTGYEPIKDSSGTVVGAYYVGFAV